MEGHRCPLSLQPELLACCSSTKRYVAREALATVRPTFERVRYSNLPSPSVRYKHPRTSFNPALHQYPRPLPQLLHKVRAALLRGRTQPRRRQHQPS